RALRPGGPRVGPRQHAALEALADGPLLIGELAARTRIGHGALKSLAAHGFVTISARSIERRPAAVDRGSGSAAPRAEPRRLTAAQSHALGIVTAALRERRHERFLLHGVTGSGKTEVYLRA